MTLHWTEPPEDEATTVDGEVIFAVDADGRGTPRAIIADVTTDDAWLAASVEDARTLSQWR